MSVVAAAVAADEMRVEELGVRLCERYDQFMEQNGLAGRTNDYEAEITITITRAIRGWNFERASDDITSEDIARWVTEERDLEWSVEEG